MRNEPIYCKFVKSIWDLLVWLFCILDMSIEGEQIMYFGLRKRVVNCQKCYISKKLVMRMLIRMLFVVQKTVGNFLMGIMGI